MPLHVCVSVHSITPRPLRGGNRILKLDSQFQVSKGRKELRTACVQHTYMHLRR